MPKVSRPEVIQTGARRRWTLEEKRRIVAESDSGTRQVSRPSTKQYWKSKDAPRKALLSDASKFGYGCNSGIRKQGWTPVSSAPVFLWAYGASPG